MAEEEQYSLNPHAVVSKVILQLILLIGIIFVFGFFLNKSGTNVNSNNDSISPNVEIGLPIEKPSQSITFPNERFLSDRKWKKYVSSSNQPISGRLINGTGLLGDSQIEMNCILSAEGQLIGRYCHENGTTLDINGYIDPTDHTLKIQLGHDSEKSLMTLSPDLDNSSNYEYCYNGEWDKKKKSVKMKFIFKN